MSAPIDRARRAALGGLAAFTILAATAQARPIAVVAAENFYGDLARQIGGAEVTVTSILNNPDQDPHEFEASAATARAIAGAGIVVYNGIGYDPWMARLLAASPAPGRVVILAADLLRKKDGDNPHLWYDPATMPAVAAALADALARLRPAQAAAFGTALAHFRASLAALDRQIASLRGKFAGTPVTATEPVFGYMAEALGLAMRNRDFQLAIMNDTEPGAKRIAALEQDLRSRAVRLLLYNRQTGGALPRRMRQIAQQAGVPVVGVTETEPEGERYQEWMSSQLDAVGRALAR